MAKNKLAKFAEMEVLPNVFQPKNMDILRADYHLKGRWREEVFRNDGPLVLEIGCGKGEYAVELLVRDGLALEKKDEFICERHRTRFKELSPEERAALAEREPAYGRVICRCETVTEGEILEALAGPIPPCSVDGVKRRVNAGMGRCQGGFCGPRGVDILARELHKSPGEIVQDQAGSWLLDRQTKGGSADV